MFGEWPDTMKAVVFAKEKLEMSFDKHCSGCFFVCAVAGQSEQKGVKVGDIIVAIADKRLDGTWSTQQVA